MEIRTRCPKCNGKLQWRDADPEMVPGYPEKEKFVCESCGIAHDIEDVPDALREVEEAYEEDLREGNIELPPTEMGIMSAPPGVNEFDYHAEMRS